MAQSSAAPQGYGIALYLRGRRLRLLDLGIAAAIVFVILSSLAIGPATAGPKRVAVYGDSLATGLFFGMQDLFGSQNSYNVTRRSKGGTGLVRDDQYDWVRQAEGFVHKDRPDVVVVSLGGNDRQDFTFKAHRVERFTEEWWIEYIRRAEQVMMALKRSAPKVYWLGIPVVRSNRMTKDYARLNVLFRELAQIHGIVYVDIWNKFRGPDQRFSPFETISGKKKRVRNRDGIHFTKYGNRRLAQIVTGAMRQQVALAQ